MEAILSEFWTDFTNPENIVGHIAYVLLIVSMMMRSMNWLRFFALLAGAISSTFYAMKGDYVSMFWEALFSFVNICQLIILQIENRRGQFSDEESYFISSCMEGVEKIHTRKLMKLVKLVEVDANQTLITQDQCPTHLQFIVDGKAKIEIDGDQIGVAKPGEFIGEMSFLTGNPASAFVITKEPTRYLAFECKELHKHLEKHPQVRHALEATFNRDLVNKLSKRGGAPLQE